MKNPAGNIKFSAQLFHISLILLCRLCSQLMVHMADDHLKPKLFPQFAKHKKQAYRICSTRYTCHDAVTPPDHLILFNILLYFFSFFIHHM